MHANGFFTALLLQEEEEKLKQHFSGTPFSVMPPSLPVITEKTLKLFATPEEELEEQELIEDKDNRVNRNGRIPSPSSSSSMSLLSFLDQVACRFCWETSLQRNGKRERGGK